MRKRKEKKRKKTQTSNCNVAPCVRKAQCMWIHEKEMNERGSQCTCEEGKGGGSAGKKEKKGKDQPKWTAEQSAKNRK
jgi:hypothetical protein